MPSRPSVAHSLRIFHQSLLLCSLMWACGAVTLSLPCQLAFTSMAGINGEAFDPSGPSPQPSEVVFEFKYTCELPAVQGTLSAVVMECDFDARTAASGFRSGHVVFEPIEPGIRLSPPIVDDGGRILQYQLDMFAGHVHQSLNQHLNIIIRSASKLIALAHTRIELALPTASAIASPTPGDSSMQDSNFNIAEFVSSASYVLSPSPYPSNDVHIDRQLAAPSKTRTRSPGTRSASRTSSTSLSPSSAASLSAGASPSDTPVSSPSISITASPSPTESRSPSTSFVPGSSLSTGGIIAIAVGTSVAGILILGTIAYIIVTRRQEEKKREAMSPPPRLLRPVPPAGPPPSSVNRSSSKSALTPSKAASDVMDGENPSAREEEPEEDEWWVDKVPLIDSKRSSGVVKRRTTRVKRASLSNRRPSAFKSGNWSRLRDASDDDAATVSTKAISIGDKLLAYKILPKHQSSRRIQRVETVSDVDTDVNPSRDVAKLTKAVLALEDKLSGQQSRRLSASSAGGSSSLRKMLWKLKRKQSQRRSHTSDDDTTHLVKAAVKSSGDSTVVGLYKTLRKEVGHRLDLPSTTEGTLTDSDHSRRRERRRSSAGKMKILTPKHSVARRQTFAVEAAPPQDTQTRFVLVPYQSTAQPVTPAASYSALPLLPRQPDIQTTALAPIMPVSLPLVPRQPDIQTGMVSGGKWVYVPEAQPAGVSRQTQAVFSPHLQGGVSSGGRVLYY